MFRKILVPTDGSELSGSAVTASLKLAEENGASIVALNIQPTYRPPIVAEVPVADFYSQEEYEKGALEVGGKLLADVAALAQAAQNGVAVRVAAKAVDDGFVAQLEVQIAFDARLRK